MASAIKSALPSHLKPGNATDGGDNGFEQRHHGKTRSHMVSGLLLLTQPSLSHGTLRLSPCLLDNSSPELPHFVFVVFAFRLGFRETAMVNADSAREPTAGS